MAHLAACRSCEPAGKLDPEFGDLARGKHGHQLQAFAIASLSLKRSLVLFGRHRALTFWNSAFKTEKLKIIQLISQLESVSRTASTWYVLAVYCPTVERMEINTETC